MNIRRRNEIDKRDKMMNKLYEIDGVHSTHIRRKQQAKIYSLITATIIYMDKVYRF